jgi:hypothetical protein
MDIQALTQTVQQSIGAQVRVEAEGRGRYLLLTPFMREDGDHYNIVLREVEHERRWRLTDEGETLMHSSYTVDYDALHKGARGAVLERVLAQGGVTDANGELLLDVDADEISAGLFTFLQTLTRVNDLSYLARETVRSTFKDDFAAFLRQTVPDGRLTFDYHHPKYDPQKKYPIDARIDATSAPVYVFAIANDAHCRDATIKLQRHQAWDVRFDSVAIFEDQTEITRDVLARFSDVGGKQFSSLASNQMQIARYLRQYIQPAA